MCAAGAVFFETAEAGFEGACVGKGERFRYLYDQDSFNEFQPVRSSFCVFEFIRRPWDAAKDLDPRSCGVVDDAEKRQTNAYCDADLEVPEDGAEEDEKH